MYNCVSLCQWMGVEGIMDSVVCLEGDARKVQKKEGNSSGSRVGVRKKKAFEGGD